jgi:hypothetical protein
VKKLSIKTTGKENKLVIHKEAVDKTPDPELESEAELPWEDDTAKASPEELAKNTPMAKVKEGKNVTGNVEIVEKNGKDVTSHEEEAVVVAEVESTSAVMANVGFGLARTINLGNFESVKVSVDIHVPSEVNEDEIDGNYEFAKGWCEQKMHEIVSAYVEEE